MTPYQPKIPMHYKRKVKENPRYRLGVIGFGSRMSDAMFAEEFEDLKEKMRTWEAERQWREDPDPAPVMGPLTWFATEAQKEDDESLERQIDFYSKMMRNAKRELSRRQKMALITAPARGIQ